MTQPVASPTHTVLRAGFTNPLTLDIVVTDASFVKVYVGDDLLDEAEYSIDGLGSEDGIEITILDGEDPSWYPDAVNITASFEPPLSQPADLSAGGVFGLAFENALDAVVRLIIASKGGLDRTVKAPFGVTGDMTLPEPVPNATLAWNPEGDGVTNGPTIEQVAALAGVTEEIVALGAIISEIVGVDAISAEVVIAANNIAAIIAAAAAVPDLADKLNRNGSNFNGDATQSAAFRALIGVRGLGLGADFANAPAITDFTSSAINVGQLFRSTAGATGGPGVTCSGVVLPSVNSSPRTYMLAIDGGGIIYVGDKNGATASPIWRSFNPALILRNDAQTLTAAEKLQVQTNTGGSSVKVAGGTVSGAAQLDIAIPAGYKSFKVKLRLVPATDGVGFRARGSTDAVTFDTGSSDYSYVTAFTPVGGATLINSSAGDTFMNIPDTANVGSGASRGVVIEFDVDGQDVSGANTFFKWEGTIRRNDGVMAMVRGSGIRANLGVTRALRFFFSSGNIASGTYEVYGNL